MATNNDREQRLAEIRERAAEYCGAKAIVRWDAIGDLIREALAAAREEQPT